MQENFYKPDPLWEIFGIYSKEDFYQKIPIKPKFHNNVPKDIIEEFKTIEYLMVLSYHHVVFLDEAVTKSLVAIEIAFKLKAKELKIPLVVKNKNGKSSDKKLFQLTEEVLNKIGLSLLQPEFNRTRSMRNSKVHKERHTFMGVIGNPINNIILIINLINYLFLEILEIKNTLKEENKFKSQLSNFQHKPMVLELERKRILIESIPIFKYIKFKDTKLVVLVIEPIINNAHKIITENPSRKPLLLTLKDFTINHIFIKGLDLKENPVSIAFTNKEENSKVFNIFSKEKQKVDEINLFVYDEAINKDAHWEIEKIIFENCWY